MISGAYLFLLQDRYFKDDNPIEAMILLIAIGAIIVFSAVIYIVRRITGKSIVSNNKTFGAPRKFNAFTLHRIASTYGLDKGQTKLLEAIFRNDNVNDPERVMGDPAALDRHFKRAFKNKLFAQRFI